MKDRVSSLEGLRFIAITLIVASHSNFLLQGGLGNTIFFALSGFLAVEPFKKENRTKFLHIKDYIRYYLNRIIRIIPLFWLYILFSKVFFNTYSLFDFTTKNSLIKNMLFLKVKGHIWFLQQEILFYITLPFIILLLSLIVKIFKKYINSKSKEYFVSIIILLVLAILSLVFNETIPIRFYVNDSIFLFYIGYFLIGMTTGYIYLFYKEKDYHLEKNKYYRILSNIAVILFMLFCILSSNQILVRISKWRFENFLIGWHLPVLCVSITCILILIILTSKDTIMDKFLGNKFFTFIGKISFTMYLFHWQFLSLKESSSIPVLNFLLIYFVSICVSMVINKYVEIPCIKLSKKIKEKI